MPGQESVYEKLIGAFIGFCIVMLIPITIYLLIRRRYDLTKEEEMLMFASLTVATFLVIAALGSIANLPL